MKMLESCAESPRLGATECHRVLRVGGGVGFTVWRQPGWVPGRKHMQFLSIYTKPVSGSLLPKLVQRAFPGMRPTVEDFDTPWTKQETLLQTLTEIGFVDIKYTPVDFEKRLTDYEGYKGQMKQAVPKVFTEEVIDAVVKGLKEDFGDEFVLPWKAVVVTATKA